jgi:HEPN domain-containing protein
MATSVDLARQLLAAAENDELMARSLLPIEGVTDAGIGFHAHQAIEKAIKGVLAAHEVKFRFTHDLGLLKQQCTEAGIALPSTLEGMQQLLPFASTERYGSSAPAGLDREQALAWAATAIAWARPLIDKRDSSQTPAPSS